jgi:hypothetical protein
VRFYSYDTASWSAQWAATTSHLRFAWELVDWLTVAMEFAIIVAMPWWRGFRIVLAGLVVFHLAVFLTMDIDFSFNVVVYGAFVSWAGLLRPVLSGAVVKRTVARLQAVHVGPGIAVLVTVFALALSGAAWFVTSSTPVIGAVSGVLIVLTGAAMGIGYLARLVTAATRSTART